MVKKEGEARSKGGKERKNALGTSQSTTKVVKTEGMPAKKGREKGSVRSRKEGKAGSAKSSKAPKAEEAPEEERFFLVKGEPESRIEKGVDLKFSIEDLKSRPNQTEAWDGVRNYQARNVMRSMRVGDLALYYHSNCKRPGVVGICRIVKEAYPDHTQFNPQHPNHDPKSSPENPRWDMVDVKFVRDLRRFVSLEELKGYKEGGLKDMFLLTRGRLSVQPVSREHFDFVVALEDTPDPLEDKTKTKKKSGIS
uniref:Thymocyte nuclear protein 1 n=1 Tax=Chromera velia CCMP2878 TaxID=1169474 RepID=A0A0G4IEA4_9ALVE|eukprot:Cvel_13616.t1-p1 / transcript=Cvel_13616.t1 / gene=Cvel_13616 / organism=Chromera_velia_CCMP2878 / gene_product=Thymocyte nuclear protein 1, putative / transcript_product=Thymocyte nuclear protein 1, putative / location=Cvel_scaffold937:45273-51639(-) / protein_length=251 / sequence_SO=supercontig / SO=protein_coding / is_pseudo=false